MMKVYKIVHDADYNYNRLHFLHSCLMNEYVNVTVFKLTYANKSKETKIHGKKLVLIYQYHLMFA